MYVPEKDNERFTGCQESPTYFTEDGTPVHWIGDFTGTEDDDPTSLIALRDMLDAASLHLEAEGSPMVRLYAGELAEALDAMGVGN